ncbi:ABC transporter permease [Glycomyces algeriensis]|uniref:ABC transporter permease n=1 Tax=Glycomyces algeriensis TaxID=256037 RepID=UPI0022DAE0D9|nr:ABC transporter permease subunit [Glycomyces algeriensis]MDA1367227.1 ABC transporter permease subunit [Glycomyces algeriensis]MDR7353389.1 peptide/nickel transport system permease protein [Glycomyces algeriensis]
MGPLQSGALESRHSRPPDRRKSLWERIALTALLAVPLGIALVGPFLPVPAGDRTQPFDPAAPWPGTDHLGSSVLDGLLDGGWGIVVTAAAATAIAFLVGLPIGLAAAATRHRWLDEVLMRPFDLLLALPSLLLMLLLASIAPPTAWMLVLIVALVNLPDIARIVRAAALEVARRPAVEAMWLQGESRGRILIGYIARSILPTVAADAGVRLVGAFYLVAAASFLGVGAGPEASDWAVMVDVNRGGIFLSPWGVVLPAALLVALSVGLNLLFDRLLNRKATA